MKIRSHSTANDKLELQMSSMIDVVFQLLIFFMLTLKIIEPEGDFDINMPLGEPAPTVPSDVDLPPMKVRLEADPNTGALAQLYYNGQPLGKTSRAFQALNDEILKSVNALKAAGPGNLDKQEVEIDPDYNLDYEHIIAAIGACSGKMVDGQMVRYISRIKFAPIRENN